jgi:hypothetical protein
MQVRQWSQAHPGRRGTRGLDVALQARKVALELPLLLANERGHLLQLAVQQVAVSLPLLVELELDLVAARDGAAVK